MSLTKPGRLATLILAAGQSRRLGAPKQLLHLGAETLLQRSVRLAQSVGAEPVHVVLGAHAALCMENLAGTTAQLHINPDWAVGMGGSLAFGIDKVAEDSHAAAALLLHVDQYRLMEDDLTRLVEAWRTAPQRIIAAAYAGTVGPPLVFPRHFFSKLRRHPGESGARDLLIKHATMDVRMPEAEFDVDTPTDLQMLKIFSEQKA